MDLASSLPKSVKLMQVGPRDGLQNETTLVATKSKIDFINDLVDAGFRRIEITAFVSPRWIPQLADQFEVAVGIKRRADTSYAALVPNVQGYERAMRAKLDEISMVISASDTHNRKNLNASTSGVLERYREIAKRAQQDGCPIRGYISCVFGCPYEGKVELDQVLSLAKEMIDLGAYEIALSDTIGVASPLNTCSVLEAVLKHISEKKIALHMHDTRGTALANIYAAMTMGISSFDSSAGGLGGCPYAVGASGNVASEDLVYMLEAMGIKTGIDLKKLCDASIKIEQVLNKQVPSKVVATHRNERI